MQDMIQAFNRFISLIYNIIICVLNEIKTMFLYLI